MPSASDSHKVPRAGRAVDCSHHFAIALQPGISGLPGMVDVSYSMVSSNAALGGDGGFGGNGGNSFGGGFFVPAAASLGLSHSTVTNNDADGGKGHGGGSNGLGHARPSTTTSAPCAVSSAGSWGRSESA